MEFTVKKKTITIVSAHEGATTWVNMFKFIGDTKGYQVRSFHQYDDNVYRSARSTWERFTLKVKTFIIFPLRFVFLSSRITRNSDFLIIVTSPFFMPLLASLVIAKKKIKVFALMNDIYPEGLVTKGIIKRGGIIECFVKRVFARAISKMEMIVFITEHHKAFVIKDIRFAVKTKVIPVSAHSDPFVGCHPYTVKGPIQIVYCGTLGLMHDTTTFLEWLSHARACDNLRLAFYTSGASKKKFETKIREQISNRQICPNVLLGNALDQDEWVKVMKAAQVGLVFQDADSGNIIFPSKVASILASGQALLAVADKNSELARLILQNDCGWVVSPSDVDYFSECVASILQADTLLIKRKNAFLLGHKLFGKQAVANQWVQLFDSF